ncbi:hypothetical protein Tco_1573346 [Tanacetum coccineum]
MDWLAYHRALIDCYEKIVRIPLPNGKILEVQGERPEKDLRSLACIKADEEKLDDIRVVRDFPEAHRQLLDLHTAGSKDSQMHNNIMAAGSKDRPPMLGPGRYSQWRSHFLQYIDTKPNGEGLRKSILSGPYVPSTVLV